MVKYMNDDLSLYDEDIKFPAEIEQYERKIYDLKQLIEISKGLNSTLDYNVLIDSILLTCMGQMQLLKAGIFTHRSIDRHEFVLHRNYKGFEIDHNYEYLIPTNSKLIQFLDANFRCYTLNELKELLPDEPSLESLVRLDPSLVVPLRGKGTLNGIIVLADRINQKDFSESDKEYMLNIASLAGIAIQNAYLYELATTDMMTKLKIHHYFQTALMEEREKSLKSSLPLSLIMMDIDHFKNFNDTYGHSCGDMVLKNVASIISGSVRQSDIAARYGGEEFAVILPHTDINEAFKVAERIRLSVQKAYVLYKRKKLSVTVSLGITQFNPAIDISTKIIIERADKALYISKQQGRNRTTVLLSDK